MPTNVKGWSTPTIEYQEYVTGKKVGTTFRVEKDGVQADFDNVEGNKLFEVKGNYDGLLNNKTGNFADWYKTGKKGQKLLGQARRQIKVANGAPIEWNFATQKTLNATKQFFEENGINEGITYKYNPVPWQK